jgi:RNA-directed DNA polymerase
VFGDADSGAYLTKFSWTKIVRHQMVAGTSSVDDPSLTNYWAARRHASTLPVSPTELRLLKTQDGRCPLCKDLLLVADSPPQSPHEWEQWWQVTRKAMAKQAIATMREGGQSDIIRLVHTRCQRRALDADAGSSSTQKRTPIELA